MLILSVKQLQEQGIIPEEVEFSQQIKCGNKIMRRVADVPLTDNDKAIEIGKNCFRLGSFSFITKSQISLTVWKEKKAQDVSCAQEIALKINEARTRVSKKIFKDIHKNSVKKKSLPSGKHNQNDKVTFQKFKPLSPKNESFQDNLSTLNTNTDLKSVHLSVEQDTYSFPNIQN